MRPTSLSSNPTRLAACLLALLCTVVLWGCGESYDGPRLSPLDSDAVILAFGDSLTHGTGAEKHQAYPAQLAEIIGRTVINKGIPGERTTEGLARLPTVLNEVQPALVILCLGGNDMLRKKPRDTMQDNLSQMIEIIKDSGAEVVLLGVPEPALFNLNTDPRYQQLAQQHSVPIENEIISTVLGDLSMKSDPIHPNDAGYAKIAEAIATLLDQAGAI